MKAAANSRTQCPAPDVDLEQIKEMLRLTPTQRLRKAWRYAELVKEMQRAGGLQEAKPK